MTRIKKLLLGLGIAVTLIFVLWLPLALGLMAGFPFALWRDDEVEPLGASATFEESADCLFQYRHYSAGRDLGVRLDSEKVAVCFPPQTTAGKQALIVCFNRYERNHPNHEGWPEENVEACKWDGLTAVPTPYGLAFSDDVVAVPAVPRAGKPFVVKVGVTGGDSAGEEVNSAIESGALAVVMTIGGVNGIPLDVEYGYRADRKMHVNVMVPRTAQGKRLTIKLTIGADTHSSTKIVAFTGRR